MTQEDILRMARQAGWKVQRLDGVDEVMDGDKYHIQTDEVMRFAAIVAAAEREACAKYVEQCSLPDSYSEACLPDIANELRARGNK